MGETQVEPAVRGGAATVVVGQRIRPGHHEQYRRWQDGLTAAAAAFPGYLGTDETPADRDGDATVVYRFDAVEHLRGWLDSPVRRRLVEQGASLFDEPPTQQVLVADGEAARPATVVVSHTVAPREEAAFLAWQDRMTVAESRSPGFLGSELFRPVPGVQDDWTAVYRFASAADLEAWLASDERRALLDEGSRFRDFRLRTVAGAFGSWIPGSGRGGASDGPPSWKTALSVLVGLYPTVVLLTLALSAVWPSGPLWAALLVGNVASVALLTWVVMPVVTRALAPWLTPRPDAPQPRTDVIGTVASLAFLTGAAVVFWLLTVQIWSLP
ncbi:antibiotic biosynthesis monooxygenase [Actinomycetospora sp. TBRC 11914]|uniref:antibiotic biosynthesis monooxygenase n=1 Tax=Actinomycetospora sp. TBRC 11914 TaxID=2729387 RepID=UPI001B7D6553|nr:antibiotic biosynthesis monooxygenase [Actinomycetospora sp. TBRC 11914]